MKVRAKSSPNGGLGAGGTKNVRWIKYTLIQSLDFKNITIKNKTK